MKTPRGTFDSLFKLLEHLGDPGVENHGYLQGSRWAPTWRRRGDASFSGYLYRGQTKRYSPCLSTGARGVGVGTNELHKLPTTNQIQLIENFIRAWWFCEALEHPAMRWADSERIYIDQVAVAQHYEIPTGYIDLTQSIDVAAFFATRCSQLGRYNLTLGIPVVVLSAVSASLIFYNPTPTDKFLRILPGIISLAVAIIASVHTWLKLPERVEDHAEAAKNFGALARKLELTARFPPSSEDELRASLVEVENAWSELNKKVPRTTRFRWPKTLERL